MSRKITLIILLLFLTSCQNKSFQTNEVKDNPFEQTSNTSKYIDQSIAENAKQLVKRHDIVTQVEAVNSLHTLVVSFNVSHKNRLQMKEKRKKIEKELKKTYPTIDIVVSTDRKILLEIEKVNQQLKEQSISTNDLQRRVREIMKLSKDGT